MTLKRLEVNNFCEKSPKINRTKVSTTNSLVLASIVTFKTNVKSFGYPPANLTVYNAAFTGQKTEYHLQSLTNLEPEWCAEHDSVLRFSNFVLVFP